jgi:transposase-like protein
MNKKAKKPSQVQAAGAAERIQFQMPLAVTRVLSQTRSAFFGLCLEAGREVLGAMMEHDRTMLCGPKDQHDSDRRAVRAGSAPSAVVLGGRRIEMRRLRARSLEGQELVLPSFAFASDQDPFDEHVLGTVAAGVSTRKYRGSLDRLPDGERELGVTKSSVSRRFVALTEKHVDEWLSESIAGLDIRVVMIDGKAFRDHCMLIAIGLDSSGKKHVLGIREGTTENSGVVKALLGDIIERGLATDRAMLFVVDGGKALSKAIRTVYGPLAVIQRCQVHKRRNVLDHLPDHMHAHVGRVLRQAWDAKSVSVAERQLRQLAASLEREHPGAAASLREGLEETLTLIGLGASDALYRTLRTTNPIENLNGSVEVFIRNVKRWRGGAMIERWVSTAVFEASKKFRRVRGYAAIPTLIAALDRRGPIATTAAAA